MNKRRTSFVISFVALLGMAFAAYDVRLAELRIQVKDDPKLTESDRTTLTKTFEEYLLERNKGLNDLLEILRKSGIDKQTDNFRSRIDNLSREVGRRNSDMSRLPISAYNVYQEFLFNEGFFLERLKKTTMPEYRDTIVKLNGDLGVYTAGLEVEWQGLLSNDQNYDDQEKAIARDLKETIESAIRQVATERKEWLEYVVKGASMVPVPGADVIASIAGKASKKAASYLSDKMQYVQRRINDYKALANYEETGINVVFGDKYQSTKQFIEKNGYKAAVNAYEKAKDEIRNIYENGTPAQKADGKEFADLALKILSDQLAEMEKTFRTFVVKHEGKFFGPVGPDLTEALVEVRQWEKEADDMKRLDLEGTLREYRNELDKTFINIDWAQISEGQREAIKTAITKELNNLLDAIKNATPVFSNNSWVINYDRKEIAKRLLDRAR